MLSNDRSGSSSPASESVLADSWLANPKKARRSVRLEGVGNLAMASVINAVPEVKSSERDSWLSVFPFVLVERDSSFCAPQQELSYVFGVLGAIAVIDDNVIDDPLISCQS